jgi:hypothetical protein
MTYFCGGCLVTAELSVIGGIRIIEGGIGS